MRESEPERGDSRDLLQSEAKYSEHPASDTEPGWKVKAEVINGRYAATELVLTPPAGQGLTRSMLHGMDIHGLVRDAVMEAEAFPPVPAGAGWTVAMAQAMEPFLPDSAYPPTGEEKLKAIAHLYRTAKLTRIPLHRLASVMGVHKKTLQRWARQAEDAGFLTAADRTW